MRRAIGGDGRKRRCAHRNLSACIEALEPRQLLSAAAQSLLPPLATSAQVQVIQPFKPTFEILNAADSPYQTSGPQGFTPSQISTAYGLNQVTFGGVTGTGAGQTIAIVDAYNDPDIQAELQGFDQAFSLASTTLTVVNQTGGTSLPGVDPAGVGSSNWEIEEALDVEWAHALAPGASIVLVEATNDSPSNLFAAVSYAASRTGVSVVSMSWGGNETSSETQYDSIFTTPSGHTGVTFVASTGDEGEPSGYPAYSPNVVAVGGTSLSVDSLGNYLSETGWSGSGGGISTVEAQPSYQNGIVTQSSTFRTNPDVAFDADPNTGVAVYDSYNNGTTTPWEVIGGTSLGAASWAGIIAVADQGRVLDSEGTLDSISNTLPLLYSAPAADFHDVTSGNNGYSARAGYDLVTGRGSPVANLLIPYLVSGVVVTPPPPPPGSGPSITSITANATTLTAGTTLILTANGVSDVGASGVTVTFYEEYNSVAGLQTSPTTGDYAFTPVTNAPYTISLDTTGAEGSYTFYAQVTDSSGGATATGTSAVSVSVTITAASGTAPNIASVTASPNPVVTGATLTLTANGITDGDSTVRRVTFYEESNGIAGLQTGVGGDLELGSVGASSGYSLQLDTTGATGPYTFYAQAVDRLGNVSASGTAAPSVTVNISTGTPPNAPTGLTATAVSQTQINLSFAQVQSGQTGFTIERATDPSFINFTRVFTITSPNLLTYNDTSLSPATTYYYRVEAFNTAGSSGFSNVAFATTQGSVQTNVPLDQQYVTELYEDILGRAPDSAGLSAFISALDKGQTTAQVVSALLSSQEYRRDLIENLYQTLLGRAADSAGLASFTAMLAAGGTDEQVAAGIYGSAEFFARSGSTDLGFLTALYEDALGRAPDAAGLASFTAMLHGGSTTAQVAALVLQSTEYRRDLITNLFQKYLQRAPPGNDLATFTAQLAGGATDESLIITLASSHEYFVTRLAAVGTLNETYVYVVFQDLLARTPTTSELQTYSNMLGAQPGAAGRQAVVLTIQATTEYRTDLVGSYYSRFLGRAADPGGASYWVAALSAGATDEAVIDAIVGSNEYYSDHGASTTGFLYAVFNDLLQQPANPASQLFLDYDEALDAGEMTPAQVAQAITSSSGYANALVNLFYQQFLLRDADPTGQAYFTGQLLSGVTDAQVIAEITASSEYFHLV